MQISWKKFHMSQPVLCVIYLFQIPPGFFWHRSQKVNNLHTAFILIYKPQKMFSKSVIGHGEIYTIYFSYSIKRTFLLQ